MTKRGTMKKTKSRKKSSKPRKSTPRKPSLSNHPYTAHADHIREVVHSALATAGISGLSLRSMQFSTSGPCPDGQHLQKVCTTDASGAQVCTWQCVDN
jgi:hypothetical protein